MGKDVGSGVFVILLLGWLTPLFAHCFLFVHLVLNDSFAVVCFLSILEIILLPLLDRDLYHQVRPYQYISFLGVRYLRFLGVARFGTSVSQCNLLFCFFAFCSLLLLSKTLIKFSSSRHPKIMLFHTGNLVCI